MRGTDLPLMRAWLFNVHAFGRAAGFLALSIIVVAMAAIQIRRHDAFVGLHSRAAATSAITDDRLASELARCTALGTDARDQACEAVWAENRRRFFGYPPPTQPQAVPAAASKHEFAP